jgi:hypothetical protein
MPIASTEEIISWTFSHGLRIAFGDAVVQLRADSPSRSAPL